MSKSNTSLKLKFLTACIAALAATGCGGQIAGTEQTGGTEHKGAEGQALINAPRGAGFSYLGVYRLATATGDFCATEFAGQLISRPCAKKNEQAPQDFALYQAPDQNVFLCRQNTLHSGTSQTCDENGCGPELPVYFGDCLASASTDLVFTFVDLSVSNDGGKTYQGTPGLLMRESQGVIGYYGTDLKVTVDPYLTALVLSPYTGAENQQWVLTKRR